MAVVVRAAVARVEAVTEAVEREVEGMVEVARAGAARAAGETVEAGTEAEVKGVVAEEAEEHKAASASSETASSASVTGVALKLCHLNLNLACFVACCCLVHPSQRW